MMLPQRLPTFVSLPIMMVQGKIGVSPIVTLPETNIFAPENGWLEDDFRFGKVYLQVRLLLILGRVV